MLVVGTSISTSVLLLNFNGLIAASLVLLVLLAQLPLNFTVDVSSGSLPRANKARSIEPSMESNAEEVEMMDVFGSPAPNSESVGVGREGFEARRLSEGIEGRGGRGLSFCVVPA